MDRNQIIRLTFTAIILVSISILVHGYATASKPSELGIATEAPAHTGSTVITVHGENSRLLAYGPDGDIRYVNDTYDRYFDVDPLSDRGATVEYIAADHRYGSLCSAPCTRNVVERVNLTTGEVTRIYTRVTPGIGESRWHDADRLDADHIVIAGILSDRVFIVNTTTELIVWQWEAQSDFSIQSTGRVFPDDWTHINDVEVLSDGRIMVSVRNQDRVVFLDRRRGLVENWTLGAEDTYSVLNEQHNPDYIPPDSGGPAVLIADSHNNRVIEYQHRSAGWEKTWSYEDLRMQWPRDADRLPNGHTLISDSNGNRVFEVDETGETVWTVALDTPYEAERLETGDESTGGPSAVRADLDARAGRVTEQQHDGPTTAANPPWIAFWLWLRRLLPSLLVNAALYVLPPWMRFVELTALALLGTGVLGWGLFEFRVAGVTIAVRWPIRINR